MSKTLTTLDISSKALSWVKNASPYFIKNLMTVEEAQKIWTYIKDRLPVVASRSGISSRTLGHLNLLKKMQMVKAKAEQEPDCCGNCRHGGLFSLSQRETVGCKICAGEPHEKTDVCQIYKPKREAN